MVYFEWDANKDSENRAKHGVSFEAAQYAFADPWLVLAQDLQHSQQKQRFYCFGWVGEDVLTVRFTYRMSAIRILGAGYWRKGRKIYEAQNKIF